MAEAAVEEIVCGFCLLEENLENPKCLPCGHVHCLLCLTLNVDVNDMIRCPWCREVFDVKVENLPSADVEDNSVSCDVCTKKGLKKVPAVIYCTACRKLFCKKHDESHDDTSDDHQKMTISDYRIQAKRIEKRVCPRHTAYPYILGCKLCIQLFCVQCASSTNLCVGDSEHKLVNLDDLIKDLINIDELTSAEDKMSAHFKQISKTLSDFDAETEELLTVLHTQRNEHLTEVRLKYEKLEKEFLASRKKTKEELNRYMEREVETVLSQLSNSRMKIEAQLRQNHQVDLVEGFAEIEHRIQRLISVEIPKLELCDIMSLKVKEEKREIEAELVPAADMIISLDQGVTTPTLPKSLKLLQSVDVSDNCLSVSKYEDNTYVGLSGGAGIDRIDESFSVSKSFGTVTKNVNGIAAFANHLYALVYVGDRNPRWAVHVYDFTGKQVTSWFHYDNCGSVNNLAIADDQVVVPDRGNKRLTIYCLTGEVIKHVSCRLLSDSRTAICAADRHCVVVSEFGSSQVFKLDLTTEEVIWTCKDVSQPEGVTCYRSKYILVTNYSSQTTIWILDVETGKQLSMLEDPTVRSDSSVLDLHVYKDMLIVPRYDERKVLFYQLN